MAATRKLANDLEQMIIEADTRMSEVGTQRENNYRNYTMQPLGNEMPGRSRYIDPSVMDVVESKKAFFRETFFSGRKSVKFLPTEHESQQQADAKTAYVERQLKLNDWYQVFRDALHDAFVSKRCTLHVEWLDSQDTTLLTATQAPPEMLAWQVQQVPDVLDADYSQVQDNGNGTLTGVVRLTTDAGRVNIKLVPQERYYRDPHADYPCNAQYCAYEEDISRGDLVREGIDPDQVDKLTPDHTFRREEEDNARKSHDGSWTRTRQHSRVEAQELISTFWTYAWLNLAEYIDDAPDDVRLYKIRWCRNEILRYADGRHAIEEVSEMPFFEWAQYKLSHASHGMCDADVLAPVQRNLSVLKRLIVDNQQMNNATRWQVQTGAVKNLRSLLDTTPGGIVEVRNPTAVTPLPAPQLSPVTYQALEMLETDKEARSGNNRLSKGMSKDAVSQQNAADMIERLTTSANKRIAGEARDFAETFLVPLMRHIYCLGVRHDQRVYQLEMQGQQTQASPAQWSEPAPQAMVAVALTPEEGVKRAMSLMQMHQMLSMDPTLGMLYGIQQKHALADELFELLGVDDASRFMMTPGSPEFMQAQQQMMQQQQEQQAQLMQQQAFQMQLAQSADNREWQKVQQDQAKMRVDIMNIASDNDRADEELDHNKVVDLQKLDIERGKLNASRQVAN